MELKISGECVRVLGERPFTKKDGTRDFTCGFVLKVVDGDFAKLIAFSVFGKEKFQRMQIHVGGSYEVSFDVASREFNGKWYTDLNAWRTTMISQGAVQAQQPSQPSAQQNANFAQQQGQHPFEQIPPASAQNVPF